MRRDLPPTTQFPHAAEPDPHGEALRAIATAIRSVRFGSVEVVIQDGRVVQIERKEKFRFDRGERR